MRLALGLACFAALFALAVAAPPATAPPRVIASAPAITVLAPPRNAPLMLPTDDLEGTEPRQALAPATDLSLGHCLRQVAQCTAHSALQAMARGWNSIERALQWPTMMGLSMAMMYGTLHEEDESPAMLAKGLGMAAITLPLFLASFPFVALTWITSKAARATEPDVDVDMDVLLRRIEAELQEVFAAAQASAASMRERVSVVASGLRHRFLGAVRRAAEAMGLHRIVRYLDAMPATDQAELTRLLQATVSQELRVLEAGDAPGGRV